MYKTLNLERNFTRFLVHPTFPHKVTVCVGDTRIFCSGVLLAQQSSVLEEKFTEDNGVLMFEELLDVNNSVKGILECINYLHGAYLQFSIETIAVVLKFASLYYITGLFKQALEWLKDQLNISKSVRDAVDFLKISNDLNICHSTQVKSVIRKFIRSNKELFGSQFPDLMENGVSGEDMILMINENLVNSGDILKKWSTLSTNNREFIVGYYCCINFPAVFPNNDDFSSFIALMSETATSVESIKFLLDLQKCFFESQKLKNSTDLEKIENIQVSEGEQSSEEDLNENIVGIERWLNISDQQFYIYNIPSTTSVIKLRQVLSFAGDINVISIIHDGIHDRADIFFQDRCEALALKFCDNDIILDGFVLEICKEEQDKPREEELHETTIDIRDTQLVEKLEVSDRQVWIYNIPYTTSDTKLRQLFSFAGRIDCIEIIHDCFQDRAIITFQDRFEVLALTFCDDEFILDYHVLQIFNESHWGLSREELNAIIIRDKQLAEKLEISDRQVYIYNLTTRTSEFKLRRVCSFAGRIQSIEILPSELYFTYAVITFQDRFEALALTFCDNEIIVDDYVLKMFKKPQEKSRIDDMIRNTQLAESMFYQTEKKNPDREEVSNEGDFNETSLYIGNLPPSADEDHLKYILRGFGKIADVKIKKSNRGTTFGYITFTKVISAYKLLQCSQRKSYNYDGCELVMRASNYYDRYYDE